MTLPANPEDFLLVGRITAPFGVRGDVKVSIITTRPDHLARVKNIYIGPLLRPYQAARFHEHKQGVFVLSLAEVTTRDAADALRGSEIYIHSRDAAPLGQDEYFLHDLVGMKVQTLAGEVLGTVVELIETGANDVLIVRQIGRQDVLVPMIRDVVARIDVPGGVIEIKSLESLLFE